MFHFFKFQVDLLYQFHRKRFKQGPWFFHFNAQEFV
jgi:hypothetical protein